jgi:hypothetical protein
MHSSMALIAEYLYVVTMVYASMLYLKNVMRLQ